MSIKRVSQPFHNTTSCFSENTNNSFGWYFQNEEDQAERKKQLLDDTYENTLLEDLQKRNRIHKSLFTKFFRTIELQSQKQSEIQQPLGRRIKKRGSHSCEIPSLKENDSVSREKKGENIKILQKYQKKSVLDLSYLLRKGQRDLSPKTFSPRITSLSLELHQAIEKTGNKKPHAHRKNLTTLSERKQLDIRHYNHEKKAILQKIALKEKQKSFAECCAQWRIEEQMVPKRALYLQKQYLNNLQKYSINEDLLKSQIPFANMCQSGHVQKVEKQQTLLAKFQSFILQSGKFSKPVKRRVQKSFLNIEREFQRVSHKGEAIRLKIQNK